MKSWDFSPPLSYLHISTAIVRFSGVSQLQSTSDGKTAAFFSCLPLPTNFRRVKLIQWCFWDSLSHSCLLAFPSELHCRGLEHHSSAATQQTQCKGFSLCRGFSRAGGTIWPGSSGEIPGKDGEEILGSWFWCLAFKVLLDMPQASVRSDPKYWSGK